MKRTYKTILVILVLAAAGAGTVFIACSRNMSTGQPGAQQAQKAASKYYCPMHPNYVSDKPGDCPICGMSLVAMEQEQPLQTVVKKRMYRSTMMPNEVSDKPGKDSMGMEMVPFEVEESTQNVEGLSTITVSPEKQQLIGIKTAVAEQRDVSRVIRTSGRVAYDPDLYYAEQEFISSVKTLEQAQQSPTPTLQDSARSLVDSSRTRLKLMGLSDEQIDRLAKKGTPDRSLLLSKDEPEAWIYAPVYEDDLRFVKPGQMAHITMPTGSGSGMLHGTVVSVDPVLDPSTRSSKARIQVENKTGNLTSEAYVNVEIDVPLGNRMTVPADAVMNTGERQVVFIDKGQGVLEPREIKTDFRSDSYYAVRSGLSKGERVVTNANFLVDSESQLKSTLKKSAGSMGGHKH
jgi:Cu(I)/Ag(I) efflux system membrane fusion protein